MNSTSFYDSSPDIKTEMTDHISEEEDHTVFPHCSDNLREDEVSNQADPLKIEPSDELDSTIHSETENEGHEPVFGNAPFDSRKLGTETTYYYVDYGLSDFDLSSCSKIILNPYYDLLDLTEEEKKWFHNRKFALFMR